MQASPARHREVPVRGLFEETALRVRLGDTAEDHTGSSGGDVVAGMGQ
jgi:hypothetical protein